MGSIDTRLEDITIAIVEILRANRLSNELYVDTFLRIIGVTPIIDEERVQEKAGDTSRRTNDKILEDVDRTMTGVTNQDLVNGLFKVQDESSSNVRSLAQAYISSLLAIVENWYRNTQRKKRRRLRRLIGEAKEGDTYIGQLDMNSFMAGGKLDLAGIVKEINKGLQDVRTARLNKQEVGELTVKLSLYGLLATQVNALLSSIPADKLGEFGGAFTNLVSAPTASIQKEAQTLTDQRQALIVESTRLDQQEELIVTGYRLGTGELVSLQSILKVLIFLLQLEYACKNCAFFQESSKGSGFVCAYAQKTISGQLQHPQTTQQSNCVVVWALTSNDYWLANQQVIDKAKDIFSGMGE